MIDLEEKPAGYRRKIRRIIWAVVLVSVGIHIIFGIGAGIWVVARYFSQPKAQFVVVNQVDLAPEDRRHRLSMEETSALRPKSVYNNRIQSLRPSKLALPTLPSAPMDTIVPLDVEALVSDQVDGVGRTGGEGDGSAVGFFGGAGDPKTGMLQGRLYDLKQTPGGEPIQMNDPAYLEIINRLARTNSLDILRRFYQAPELLYLPRLAIPMGDSREAPRAFKVDGKVQPQYWVAIYTGRMIAPESGTFKFVGFGDDILLVKVDGRLVFDGSHMAATRLYKREGVSFTVKEGKAYDIELIIGECPGTYFGAWLQIQKQGGGGSPYWFRMNSENVPFTRTDLTDLHVMPEEMSNGPIWLPAPMRRAAIGLDPLTGD